MLKENGHLRSIINTFFQRFTNNHSFSQSRQQTQATDIQKEKEIRMSINLPYVESFSGKLRRIIKPHKIWSTFHTQSTLRKILCKQKDRVATEDKNNIFYKIVCSNCKAVYFGEYKRCLKSCSGENKRYVRIAIMKIIKLKNTVGKWSATLAGIRRKLLIF